MNYLSGAIHYIKGNEAPPSAAIPRLVDRVTSSSLPRDRRDAVALLASAAAESPSSQAEVGEQAIKPVYAVLEQDKDFDESVRAVLDVLITLCGVIEPVAGGPDEPGVAEQDADSKRSWTRASREAAATNTDLFLGLPNAMALLLELLEVGDLVLRCGAIELLTAMSVNSRETVQGAVLAAPEAVARLSDLLDDQSPIVRTNATLLLSSLAEESPEICKIITFSGVLDTLFRILSQASAGAGGNQGNAAMLEAMSANHADDEADPESAIAVSDSLQLVQNLLRGSSVAQTFLRDSACIPRLAQVLSHAAMVSAAFNPSALAAMTEPARSVAAQNHANVVLGLDCVRLLVAGDSPDATRNRTACASAGIVRTVLHLSFALPPAAPGMERDRDVLRTNAMLCAAELVSGHEEVRTMFASPMAATGGSGAMQRSRPPQLFAAEIVTSDASAAVRAAANALLTASLKADPALGLPATALLNALVADSSGGGGGGGGGGGALGGSSASDGTGDFSPSSSPVGGVAAVLKANLVGWPNDADGAGVFYAACDIAWVCARLRGARERLLAAHVSGSGDVLLSRAVRCLGQAVREEGPAAVRISLLRLICTWLYSSPSAVSAFLSSAMHLPLIVELVSKKASRGDAAVSAHTQGLAALVLAICLESVQWEASSSVTDGGFISGGGGASTVVPRATLVDIVRNRIGVATFTARLDELRATRAFTVASKGQLEETKPLQLLAKQSANGCVRGDLGHELWYDEEFAALINEVYGKVSSQVLELVAEERPAASLNGRADVASSGGMPPTHPASPTAASNAGGGGVMSAMPQVTPSSMVPPLIESSSRDEVLVSYKELIRSQDSSLAKSRGQVEELEAALREAQLELDAKNRSGADGATRTEREQLKAANASLTERSAALEAMLQEKTEEFAALSEAYSALESMERGGEDEDAVAEREQAHRVELERLRQDKAAALSQFYGECDKVSRLENLRSSLVLSEAKLQADLQAVENERNALRQGGASVGSTLDGVDAGEWKRRAEASESQVQSLSDALRRSEDAAGELRGKVRSSEVSCEEAVARASVLTESLEKARSEATQLQVTRKREAQIARETALAAEAATKAELDGLRGELEEMRSAQANAPPAEAVVNPAAGNLREVSEQRDYAVRQAEAAGSELMDLRNSVAEWKERAASAQQKADDAEQTLAHEQKESRRLASVAREAQGELDSLKADTTPKLEDLSTATRRVTELEGQCADLEEMRARYSEELDHLKEEVASRAEQTIRLSGKVYEAEESRVAAETKSEEALARIQELEAQLHAPRDQSLQASDDGGSRPPDLDGMDHPSQTRSDEDQEYISALSEEIISLKSKMSEMQETLDDANDKQGLSSAIAHDRDDALQRLASIEKELAASQTAKALMEAQVEKLEDRMLLLSEAEEAKRMLTTRVGELEQALAAAEASSASPPTAGSTTASSFSRDTGAAVGSGSDVTALRTELDEKTLRIAELESSLKTFADSAMAAGKNITELEKQLSESEALLSVVSGEKAENAALVIRLEGEADTLRGERDQLVAKIKVLEEKASSEAAPTQLEDDRLRVARAELEAAQQQITSLEGVTQELEAAKGLLDEQEAELLSVRSERDTLVKNAEAAGVEREEVESEQRKKRDLLELDLQTARKDIRALEDDLQAARERNAGPATEEIQCAKRERDEAVLELAALGSAAKDADKEIEELKAALSDAAKSFKASAKELVQREELLVDISRDKTAITNDLERARETIEDLREEGLQSATAFAEEKAKLIEQVVAAEKRGSVVPASSEARATPILVPTSPNGTSSSMSTVSAAQLALTASLVGEVERKFALLEAKQAELVGTAKHDKDRIKTLVGEVSAAKASQSAGDASTSALRAQLETQAASSASEVAGLRAQVELQTKQLEAKTGQVVRLEQDIESLRIELLGAQTALKEARTEQEELRAARDEHAADASRLESDLASSQASLIKLREENTARVADVEGQIVSLSKAHDEALDLKRIEIDGMTASLEYAKKEAEDAAKDFENRLDASAKRVAELEAEVDSGIESLETAERGLRDAKAATRSAESDAAAAIEKLEGEKTDLEKVVADKENAIAEANSTAARDKAGLNLLLNAAKEETTQVKAKLSSSERKVDIAERDLRTLRAEVVSADSRLADSASRIDVLNSKVNSADAENERLGTIICGLESTVKDRDEAIAGLRRDVERAETALRVSNASVEEEKGNVASQNDEISKLNSEVDRLRSARGRLEGEVDTLHSEVDTIEAARAVLEKDNADLRTWVKDLEEQANGLQALAEKFEDVETSLDEAVAAHQAAMTANAGLTSKVESLSAELEEAQSVAKTSQSEKESAEATASLARRQMEEVDARLLEIRSAHTSKLSATEDKIRANVTKTAELEQALATAERQLAESATLSDRIFAVETELTRTKTEASSYLARAEAASAEADAARREVSRMEKELVAIRTSTGGEAYAELEAEHNELLMCLAELELEHTALKDTTTHGRTTTIESVSAR